ncbi:hypothetical protein LCGC14_2236690 [marine sediment metagenome]|uniref:Uncharacterized protein n=1 Tax=marine sediment metagenome TaxID=412755 RepID=A0A0F9FJ94_9ZZZZ
MGVGDLTVTLVASYDTIELAIVGWTAGTDTTPATDSHQLIIEPGIGTGRYHLVKIVKATA